MPPARAPTLPAAWFEGDLHDLAARGALDQLRAILTGYLGGPQQAGHLAGRAPRRPARPTGG